jgi:hypothetical protein
MPGSLRFWPNGSRLAVVGEGIQIWEPESPVWVRLLTEHARRGRHSCLVGDPD